MRRLALSLLSLLLGGGAAGVPALADDVSFFRVADEGSLTITAARAARGTGPDATVVIVLEDARGNRLFLRRAPREGGGTAYEIWLGGPPGITFMRHGDAVRVEAGGRTLTVVEAELQRPTVACWVATLVAGVEPKLLDVAAGLRLLKEQTGGPPLDDAFLPIRLLWPLAAPSDLRWRGAVRFQKGPFQGETFDRLAAAATAELGKR
ncbi:MAG TPA: hypothetical protein VMN04_03925 [Thermoanaerobaculia bacterium]|nr:hypothetical protein [Thermoanaerobaculia bacterium]